MFSLDLHPALDKLPWLGKTLQLDNPPQLDKPLHLDKPIPSDMPFKPLSLQGSKVPSLQAPTVSVGIAKQK